MSSNITFNGVTYAIPDDGDFNWGPDLTAYFIAIASSALQKTGGSFTLGAETDFGASYGLKSLYYKSRHANPAAAGQVRLGNLESISWRNNANNADLALTSNASDALLFNSKNVLFSALGLIVNADVNAAAAIAYSKLNLTGLVVNADIAAAAAIAYSKLAALTASRLLVSSAGGVVSVSAVTDTEAGYLAGVTSAIQTQMNTKQLRSVLTTKGDLYVATASDTTTRLPAGSDDQMLVADSAQAAGLAYQTYIDPSALFNVGIACSVGSNALTIALKTAAGNNASSTDPIRVGFRSATLTSGIMSFVKCTAALSTVISSGSTAGHVSAQECEIYVGLLNNAGALELCWSAYPFDENALISTTAEGGAGAADVASTIYSTTARSNVAVRMIGRLLSTQTTAGTWAVVPTNIQVGSLAKIRSGDVLNQQVYLHAGNGYGSTNTKIRRYTNAPLTATDMVYADSATNGMSVTVGKWGLYSISRNDAVVSANLDVGISLNSNQLTTNVSTITASNRVAIWEMPTTGSANSQGNVSATRFLGPGDVIRAHDNLAATDTGVYSWFLMTRVR